MNNVKNETQTHPEAEKEREEREEREEGGESSEHKLPGAPADDGTPLGSTDQHSDA